MYTFPPTCLPDGERISAVRIQLNVRYDDEHPLVPARPDPPVAFTGGRVLAGEVGGLQDAQAVLRVERAVAS